MKKYQKPQMVAKNAPAGSYAAGCPRTNHGRGLFGMNGCRYCEITK